MNPLNEDRLKHVKRQKKKWFPDYPNWCKPLSTQALEGIAAINGYPDWNHFFCHIQ